MNRMRTITKYVSNKISNTNWALVGLLFFWVNFITIFTHTFFDYKINLGIIGLFILGYLYKKF
jgi:hypothetical protein